MNQKNILGMFLLLVLCVVLFGLSGIMPAHAFAAGVTNVWWPKDAVSVQGVQPFKAMVEGTSIEQYDMYWQVDGGQLNGMSNNYQDYPHKEAIVDLSGWHWRGSGPYTITFVAKHGGSTISQQSVRITIPQANQPAAQPQTVVLSAPATERTLSQTGVSGLYIQPNSSAAAQASAWRQSRPSDAIAMDLLAKTPTANWFGNWNSNVYQDVHIRAVPPQLLHGYSLLRYTQGKKLKVLLVLAAYSSPYREVS